jgi:hypothetical protein
MKTLSSGLSAAITSAVTTLAICVDIERSDGKRFFVTNHDTDLVVDGHTYSHLIPFQLSAISSGSQMATDNVDLTLSCDETTFKMADFKNGRFTHAACRITLVDFTNTSAGAVTLRRGTFGAIEVNQTGNVKITVVGMLSVLDNTVGQVYSASCTAELGDKRCKVAIDEGQVRSPINPVAQGEWYYVYDPALMNALTITNPSFETNVGFTETSAITGWTKSSNARFKATAGVAPIVGSQALCGGTAAGGATNPEEMFVYQDLDLVAQGVSSSEIDAGHISFLLLSYMVQHTSTEDCPRLRYDVLDASGNVIDYVDTGYLALDTLDAWRERACAGPLISGARTVRIYLYMLRGAGTTLDAEMDNVRAYWWNNSTGTPYSGVIQRVARIINYGPSLTKNPPNNSFELSAPRSNNATANDIPYWVKTTGSYFSVGNSLSGLPIPDGSYMLLGGNAGGGSATEYVIKSATSISFNTVGVDLSRSLLGYYLLRVDLKVLYGDTTSGAGVKVEFRDALGTTILSTVDILPDTVHGSVGTVTVSKIVKVPTNAFSMRFVLRALPPAGSPGTLANVGFDALTYAMIDTGSPTASDSVTATGDAGTVFLLSPGDVTLDNNAIFWSAHTAHVYYDTVTTVVSDKFFNATTMSGADGDFERTAIRWVSGANAGQSNIIRHWTSTGKGVKLYFKTANPIQIGDRFRYVRPCHKRFSQDCIALFANAVNFRGFPHLPGKLDA